MKKARCFISYCSSDAKPDDVSAIVRYLDQMARSKEYNIEFLFDKDLSVGNDLNEFMQEIITVDSIIVIWCGPCKMLSPIVDEVAEENTDIKVCKINVDEEPELAMRYNVMSIPTLVVIQNGEEVNKSVGLVSKEDIIKMVK